MTFPVRDLEVNPAAVRKAIVAIDRERWTEMIPDPGDGGTLSSLRSGIVSMNVVATGETTYLGPPVFAGQVLIIVATNVGTGDTRDIDNGTGWLDLSGHTVMTFSSAGQLAILLGHPNTTWLQWQIIVNLGATLS